MPCSASYNSSRFAHKIPALIIEPHCADGPYLPMLRIRIGHPRGQNLRRHLRLNFRLTHARRALQPGLGDPAFRSSRRSRLHLHALARRRKHARRDSSLFRRQNKNSCLRIHRRLPRFIQRTPRHKSNLMPIPFHPVAFMMMPASRHPHRVAVIWGTPGRNVAPEIQIIKIPAGIVGRIVGIVPAPREARPILHQLRVLLSLCVSRHLPRFHRAPRCHCLVHQNLSRPRSA
jgi:hypothetical protein